MKSYIATELNAIDNPLRRRLVADFLELGDLVVQDPTFPVIETVISSRSQVSGLIFVDEEDPNLAEPIEETFDEDLQCPILPILQGKWVVSGSSPDIEVSINGRNVEFSNTGNALLISRAHQESTPEIVEWVLGLDMLLVKSASSFTNPQKVVFGPIFGSQRRRGDTFDKRLVLVRGQPVASEYSTASSTLH